MFNYPAVWKIDMQADSLSLLEEFNEKMSGELSVIYPKNTDWTGISVFSGSRVNYLPSLPVLQTFLNKFGLENVIGVTFFNLAPNSVLHRHRDMNGNLLFGVIRLHIPLQTNPKAIMEVQLQPVHMPLNTVWALDTSGLHALENGGDKDRIHLVVDVKYGKATAQYFPRVTFSLVLHFFIFIFIASYNILRDIFIKPASLFARLHTLYLRITKK